MDLCSIEKQQNRKPDCPEILQTADRLVCRRQDSGSGVALKMQVFGVYFLTARGTRIERNVGNNPVTSVEHVCHAQVAPE